MIERWFSHLRHCQGYPKSYRASCRADLIRQMRVQVFLTALLPIFFVSWESPYPIAVLASVWVLALVLLVRNLYPQKASVRPFFSVQIGWDSNSGISHKLESDRTKRDYAPGNYYAVFRNFQYLLLKFDADIDVEKHLYQFSDGLQVPWSMAMSQELLQFFEQISEQKQKISVENGIAEADQVAQEIEEILHYLRFAQANGADCALVIMSGGYGMERTNGFF